MDHGSGELNSKTLTDLQLGIIDSPMESSALCSRPGQRRLRIIQKVTVFCNKPWRAEVVDITGHDSFNLLDERWIVVLTPDGRESSVSIIEAFDQARRWSTVSGEVPTQAFAITRLLLAFLHRAIDGPEDGEAWAKLWYSEELPMDAILRYADRVRSRFDLFDDTAPFFQVASLRTKGGEISGLEKIVADVPNGEPLFTTRSTADLQRITPAEAARWLVHVHAFDPSGIKSGAVGDLKAKAGKGYPIGTGWSGQLGGVLAEGKNLRETLLLNLVCFDLESYVRIGGPNDRPPWECEPDKAAWSDRPPRGAIDLYTWQTRRVKLAGGRDGVTGVVLANGDKIQPQNRHTLEPHTAWRHSPTQSAKLKSVVYMPRMHDPTRSVWRGLEAMLPSASPPGSGRDIQRYRAPGVLKCISDLVGEGHLPEDTVVRLRVLGAKYGAQSATFAEIIEDALPMSVLLLRQDRPEAGQAAIRAVKDTEHAASCVGRLAENLAQAAGEMPESGASEKAREALYSALEQPYRRWLQQLQPGCDLRTADTKWQRTVREACRPISTELITAASPSAWVGRVVNGRYINVPLVETWFDAALRKALPGAFPLAATRRRQHDDPTN